MADKIPPGAIPEEEYLAHSLDEPIPKGAIPEDQFNRQEAGTGTGILKTAIEQGISGASLGASEVLETKGIPALGIPPLTTPEAILARRETNPAISILSNIGGTVGTLAATGGLSALIKAPTVAARIGIGALEGAGIGGITKINDDWSQNKPLDAQKIAASAGLGALLGSLGSAIGEKIAAVRGRLVEAAKDAAKAASDGIEAPVLAPEVKGVRPTTFQDIQDRVNLAKSSETAIPLPAQAELDDALSRIPLKNPVNPLQRDSLASQTAKDIYQTAKETPGEISEVLSNYEGTQKAELVSKLGEGIQNLAPEVELTSDSYQAGKHAIDAFTKEYQGEKQALAPVFEALKKLPVSGDILPVSVTRMTEAVPGIANMFEAVEGKLAIRPYRTSWGIDKSTYSAVKEAVQALQEDANPSLQTLWNVRKGLDQHVDVLTQGQAPSEIRALKASLMDVMQQASNNPTIRDAFKRYAINEQQRQVIEKAFGASVGSKEFGQISKVKPEYVADRIFGNSATVEAAKNILPEKEFNTILANWFSKAKEAATDKGTFSSNKFGRFLRSNEDVLNVAFKDKPSQLQNLRDLITIMRILPDAPSINPSGTAKTLSRMLPDLLALKAHNLTWEGILASIPKKIADEISKKLKMNELNQFLSGQALKNSQAEALRRRSIETSEQIEKGVKALFSGSASQSRKVVGQ